MAAGYFLLRVGLDVLGDLAADGVVGVVFHLLLVLLLVAGQAVQLCLQDLVALLGLSQVGGGVEGMEVHPALIVYVLEQPGDEVVVLLIDGDLAATFLGVEAGHHPVEKPHDEVVVVAVLAVSEHHIAFLQ